MGDLTVEITGLGEIIIAADLMNARIRTNFGVLMEQSLQLMEDSVKEHTPIGPTKDTFNSIVHEDEGTSDTLTGFVYSNYEDQAAIGAIELCRGAGLAPPPVSAIEEWLAWAGGDPEMAYVVARSIGENGTEGHFMFRDGFASAQGAVLAIWDTIFDNL